MVKILKFLLPYWKAILLATLAIAVSTVCDLMLPTIMSEILNTGVYRQDMSYILSCSSVMLLISLVGFFTVLLGSWLSAKVDAGFCADMRIKVFRKVNAMSFEEFGKLGTAALVTRATHDVETLSWIASQLCGTVVTIPVLFFGGVILAMRKDVTLSLILLAFVPVIVAIVLIIGKKILPLWDKSDEYIDKQNDIMRQRLRGIRVIRAFGAENHEHEKISDATKVMAEYIIKSNTSMGLITPVASFLLNFATVLIVYFSAVRIENVGNISGGDVFAIVQYISLVSSGLIMGAFSIVMFPHAKVAARRIDQVLSAEGFDTCSGLKQASFGGNIDFHNVCFSYKGASEMALKDISIHIREGEKIAVIGGTGSGKSTIVSMLLGFRIPTSGSVCLNGVPTTDLDRHWLRDNISCVLQNTSVYSGDVRENVLMGNEIATDFQLREALEDAQAWEFVSSFPEGVCHEITQSGKNLSGGQKQRICIARAILKDASVYVFDDCFSALDFLTEAKLRRSLERRLAGKTQIIITQRISSAMHCDRIYVLDKGELVGCGDHGTLLDSCDVYREIYASQTGGVL